MKVDVVYNEKMVEGIVKGSHLTIEQARAALVALHGSGWIVTRKTRTARATQRTR